MESIETSCTCITLSDDGIVKMERLPDGVEITAAVVPEQVAVLRRLIGERRCPLLADPVGKPTADSAVWAQFLPEMLKMFSACGILHDEEHDGPLPPFARVLDTMLCPTKLFTDEAEAIEWLSSFLRSAE